MAKKGIMRGFAVRRWWTFILILWLGFAVRPAESAMLRSGPVILKDGSGSSTGDPDDPMAGGGKPDKGGTGTTWSLTPGPRTGGDSGRYDRMWMWRLQAVLRALPRIYFR